MLPWACRIAAFRAHAGYPSALVREHVHWALGRHGVKDEG